ncbi:MAG TPA: DUF4097 family beta strand repeat-containing protein [Thermoanaerobaculia bacterium]|nr:DUF4097 family beta strand repeat-containing protein [Thermoanaerobaculia bacterium]
MRTARSAAAAIGFLGILAAAPTARAADVTRKLEARLSGTDVAAFAVENLAGTMRIEPGPDGEVSVEATVHADDDSLARGMRLERIAAESTPTLRVRYPDGVTTIRYRAPHDGDDHGFSLLIFDGSHYDYDGHRYRVSSGHGKRLWADLVVRVPAHLTRARFRDLAGLVDAQGFEGAVRFEVASADLALRRLGGDLTLSGSSGDTRASDIRGRWKSDFSSGDCELDGFDGDALTFDTSSGDVRVHGAKAARIAVETSSGDASFRSADVEEFQGHSSSGDFLLEQTTERLKNVRVHTSSGDVRLRLPREASFQADADQSSGDMSVAFHDGSSTMRRHKLVGFQRGEGGANIRVETSSGDLTIAPR